MQVKRHRRRDGKSPLPRRLSGRKLRLATAGGTVAALVLTGTGIAVGSTVGFGTHQVGQTTGKGLVVSDDQVLKPLGQRLETQLGKFMGSTVSPDGRFLAATSTDKSVVLQIFDLKTYKPIWSVGTAPGVSQSLSDGTVGQEGPTYSPDGKFLWLPQQNGLTRFPVNAAGTLGTPTSVPIPAVNGHSALVGQTRYSPDGSAVLMTLTVPVVDVPRYPLAGTAAP